MLNLLWFAHLCATAEVLSIRAQYGDAGGEMLPIKLIEDLTGTPLRLPALARSAGAIADGAGTRPDPRRRAGVTMAAGLSSLQLAIAPTPTAHFGAGGIHKLGPC